MKKNKNAAQKNIKCKASLSIEMSVVCTIFFFCMVTIFVFFEILVISSNVQSAITSVARELAEYDYIYELAETKKETKAKILSKAVKNGLSSVFVKERVKQLLPENGWEEKYIKNGLSGISCLHSDFSEKGIIDIVVTYKIKGVIRFFGKTEIPIRQRARVHGWCGYQKKKNHTEEKEEIVYITVTGTVYHRSKDCSHLKLSIHMVNDSLVSEQRNCNGGKYYACEKCGKDIHSGTVYITDDGSRYHSSLNCSGLKRGIISVTLSEVKGRKACQRCG